MNLVGEFVSQGKGLFRSRVFELADIVDLALKPKSELRADVDANLAIRSLAELTRHMQQGGVPGCLVCSEDVCLHYVGGFFCAVPETEKPTICITAAICIDCVDAANILSQCISNFGKALGGEASLCHPPGHA